uniref:Uncharacterized protein n=1 Tax=Oryza punctata TaxID=4537 RepID=A0A0E0JDZ4_ORYPU
MGKSPVGDLLRHGCDNLRLGSRTVVEHAVVSFLPNRPSAKGHDRVEPTASFSLNLSQLEQCHSWKDAARHNRLGVVGHASPSGQPSNNFGRQPAIGSNDTEAERTNTRLVSVGRGSCSRRGQGRPSEWSHKFT